jgi:hypothetical protein
MIALARWLNEQPDSAEFIGEDFRSAGRIEEPHHPNAWGAVWATATRSGLVSETGTLRKMRAPGSHARRSPVYRKVDAVSN